MVFHLDPWRLLTFVRSWLIGDTTFAAMVDAIFVQILKDMKYNLTYLHSHTHWIEIERWQPWAAEEIHHTRKNVCTAQKTWCTKILCCQLGIIGFYKLPQLNFAIIPNLIHQLAIHNQAVLYVFPWVFQSFFIF